MTNPDNPTPIEPKPIVYACSGCSDAGELADRVARQLTKDGVGEMSCLAGIGGRVKPLMIKGQKARRIVVVDGCPLNCARHTLLNAGFNEFQHIALQELGHRKGNCPVTEERVVAVSAAAADLVLKAEIKRETPVENSLVTKSSE
jgi:uncharacterized metal-binding protein